MRIELQEEDILYLVYYIDREINPKGAIGWTFKKAYGNATVYANEICKRPSAKNTNKGFEV